MQKHETLVELCWLEAGTVAEFVYHIPIPPQTVKYDSGLLESAVNRPRHKFLYGEITSPYEVAACYCWGIIRNHPFLDGNKRIGLITALNYLELYYFQILTSRGVTVHRQEVEVYVPETTVDVMKSVARNETGETELARWFAENVSVLVTR